VILFVSVDSDFEWPTKRYVVADCAAVQLNDRDWSVALTNSHKPSIAGAGQIQKYTGIKFLICWPST